MQSSSAYQLGISPPKMDFDLVVGEKECVNLEIFSKDYKGKIEAETRWSNISAENRDLRNYFSSGAEKGIILEYDNSFKLNMRKTLKICISADYGGDYYGVFLLRTAESNMEVGGWIKLHVTGRQSRSLTGFTSRELGDFLSLTSEKTGKILSILLFNTLLFGLLLLLLVRMKKVAFRKKRMKL